jgi:hypothetical protein
MLSFSRAASHSFASSSALVLARRTPVERLAQFARFDLPFLWCVARLLPFLVVYVFAGFAPESDVATCFWPQALGALAGLVPYRDFESFFGPFYPHLLAVPLIVWKDPRAIILWMTLLEAVTIALTLRAAKLSAPGLARTRFLLCCFLAPGPLLLEIIGGQEDFLLWTFGLLTWAALSRSREVLAGFVTAAAMLCTKVLFLLPLAGFFGLARSRPRYLALIVPTGVVAALVLWQLTGTAFLSTLGQSGNISPPQIWILLHFLSQGLIPAGTPVISFSVVALLLLVAFAGAISRADELRKNFTVFAAGWTVLFALLLILSPKSQGAYFANFALPCLLLVIDRPRLLVVWVVAGALGVIEPSLFYRLGEQHPASIAAVRGPAGFLDLALQAVLVASFAALAWHAWQIFRRAPRPPP